MQSPGLLSLKNLRMVTSRFLRLAAHDRIRLRKQSRKHLVARVDSNKRKKTTVLRRISANPAIAGKVLSGSETVASFSDLQLNSDVVKALQAVNVIKPTVIQVINGPVRNTIFTITFPAAAGYTKDLARQKCSCISGNGFWQDAGIPSSHHQSLER